MTSVPPTRKPSRIQRFASAVRWLWARTWGKVVLVVVVIAVLAVAFSPADDTTTPAAETPTPAAAPASTPVSQFDRPTATERAALVKRLEAIEPRIATNPERYVTRSVDTCQMIQAKEFSREKQIATTVLRFQGGTLPDFSRDQAVKALAAVRDTFCD